jgi:hypothetical protein
MIMWRHQGGQTAILVHWSAAQRAAEIIADQRTGKNSGPVLAHGLPKLSFRYSALLHLFGLFLKIFQREKYHQIMGVGTDTAEQQTAESQSAACSGLQ